MALLQIIALLSGFFFGVYITSIWHGVWFGEGAGAVGRLLARLFVRQGKDAEAALAAAEQLLRVATPLIMLAIAVICFYLVQALIMWK